MIDLHLHSLASDGELSPSELVLQAKQENITVISLTDHDSISGLCEAKRQCEKLGITFIPGVELEASTEISRSRYIHILAYNFKDYTLLGNYLNNLKVERQQLIRDYVILLNSLGYTTSFEEISSLTPGTHLAVYHVVMFLCRKGYFNDFSTAKKIFINPDAKYYIRRNFYDVEFIIQLILKAGGIPVLAHPCRLPQKGEELDSYLAFLTQKGLKGIESYYSQHSKNEIVFYEYLSRKYNLIQTAGSDWHSPNESIKMGMHLPNEDQIVSCILK